jgi:hypothetical protein
MRRWRRDKELRRLEADLRASRHEAPTEFLRNLVAGERDSRWLTPRLRIGVAVALGALALAAMASAGGVGVVTHGTKTGWHVVKRTTHKSAPRRVLASAGSGQYVAQCGGPGQDVCHITIFDAQVKEGNSGTTALTFTLSLDATNSVPITVTYNTTPGTATPGTCGVGPDPDYVSQPAGMATFPAFMPSTTITITVCGDTVPEPNETLNVNLLLCSGGGCFIDRNQAQGTILNDDH